MSHYPPNGPPGYYGHPPPPPPGSYAYVPTPVMLPMPYPHPVPPMHPAPDTYVTNNYIYQQPVQPVQPVPPPPQYDAVRVVDFPEAIDWVPATPNTVHSFAHRAVKAGHEGWDGSPLWVIRAYHSGDLVPGKLAIKHRAAFIAYCGKELPLHNFEVLCAQPGTTRWLPGSNGQVPIGAIAAGNTASGEPLYVGRVRHMLSLTPGKVHPSHSCCYISYNGQEISYKNYEVLCKIVG